MDTIWDRNPSKSEVIVRCGGDEKNEWPRRTDKTKKHWSLNFVAVKTHIWKGISIYFMTDLLNIVFDIVEYMITRLQALRSHSFVYIFHKGMNS